MKTLSVRVGRLLVAIGGVAVLAAADGPPAVSDAEADKTKADAIAIADASATGIKPVAAAEGELESPAAGAPDTIQAVSPAVGKLPPNFKPSPALEEIVKLAQSGVGEQVLLAYIAKANTAFNPTPDDIIFLNDLGASEAVIASLIRSQPGTEPAKPETATLPAGTPPPTEVPAPTQSPVLVQQPVPPLNGVVAAPAPGTVVEQPAPVVVVQPVQTTSVNYFYPSLAPYGNWVELADYGWCWQPTVAVVNAGWRPYCDRGRWLYSDCGWYWQSDYSWGWAPFHYGRWSHSARVGWVWVPDTVWGPSWVSWRYTDSYCGWAPLPPAARYRPGIGFFYHDRHVSVGFEFGLSYSHYSFVPINRFCDRAPYRHIVPATHVTTIYNQTKVVNNYITVNNHTVVNEGISRDRIARAVPAPITKVAIKEIPLQKVEATVHPDRITTQGGRPVVYRPKFDTAKLEKSVSDLRQPRATAATVGPAPTLGNPVATTAKSPHAPHLSRDVPKPSAPAVVTSREAAATAVQKSEAKTPAPSSRTQPTIATSGHGTVTPLPVPATPVPHSVAPATQSTSSPASGATAATKTSPTVPTASGNNNRANPDRLNKYISEIKTRAERNPENTRVAPSTPTPAPAVTPNAPAATPSQRNFVRVQPQPSPPRQQPSVDIQPPRQRIETPPPAQTHSRQVITVPSGRQAPIEQAPESSRGRAARQATPNYTPPNHPQPAPAEAPPASVRQQQNGPAATNVETGRQNGRGQENSGRQNQSGGGSRSSGSNKRSADN